MKNLRKNVMLLLRRREGKEKRDRQKNIPHPKTSKKEFLFPDRFSGFFFSLERQRCTEGTFYITSPSPPWFSARRGVCLGVLGLVRPSLRCPNVQASAFWAELQLSAKVGLGATFSLSPSCAYGQQTREPDKDFSFPLSY